MTTNEKAAQKARADRLRMRIEEIKSGDSKKKPKSEPPRDFIERRMRELERENRNTDKDSE